VSAKCLALFCSLHNDSNFLPGLTVMTNNVSLQWLHCLGLLLRVLVVLGLNATLKLIRPSSSSFCGCRPTKETFYRTQAETYRMLKKPSTNGGSSGHVLRLVYLASWRRQRTVRPLACDKQKNNRTNKRQAQGTGKLQLLVIRHWLRQILMPLTACNSR